MFHSVLEKELASLQGNHTWTGFQIKLHYSRRAGPSDEVRPQQINIDKFSKPATAKLRWTASEIEIVSKAYAE
jgi:hypothetical protein